MSFKQTIKEDIFEEQFQRCATVPYRKCKSKKFKSIEDCEFDHIIENSLTKDSSLRNCQALCRDCHAAKTRLYNKSPIKKFMRESKLLDVISSREILVKVPLKRISVLGNWSKNRPPDESRVESICMSLKEKTLINGVIYIFEDGAYGDLLCYDGFHRVSALKKMLEDNSSCSMYVHINVLLRASEEDVIPRFHNINQCSPVPKLYLEEDENNAEKLGILKTNIEDCVSELQKKFPSVFSSSSRPKKPNINRDKLIDVLYEYCITKNRNYSSEELLENLVRVNEMYSEERHISYSKYPPTAMKKAHFTKCYLFLKDFTEDM